MTNKNEKNELDDGRRIADMSAIERPRLLVPGRRGKEEEELRDEESLLSRPKPEELMSKEDRRAYLLGAMGAALVIGLIFVGAAAVVILLMLRFWR